MRIHRQDSANPAPEAPAPKRKRRMVLVGAGALALVLATTGIVAAMADRSSPATQAPSNRQAAPAAQPQQAPAVADSTATTASEPVAPAATSDPLALANGTYPAYIHEVDVHGATITFDVVQVFQNKDAVEAALEDGKPADEAQYLYIYLRNENPRLRTFSVASSVVIEFLGTCEGPGDRDALLTELAEKAVPLDTAYYYDLTVVGGVIHHIAQHIAGSAC